MREGGFRVTNSRACLEIFWEHTLLFRNSECCSNGPFGYSVCTKKQRAGASFRCTTASGSPDGKISSMSCWFRTGVPKSGPRKLLSWSQKHITAGWKMPAGKTYVEKHNQLAGIMSRNICIKYEFGTQNQDGRQLQRWLTTTRPRSCGTSRSQLANWS